MQILHDLMVNNNYATLKQTAAERVTWRHYSGISSTSVPTFIAEDYRGIEILRYLIMLSSDASGWSGHCQTVHQDNLMIAACLCPSALSAPDMSYSSLSRDATFI